jgi:hypothetical protein
MSHIPAKEAGNMNPDLNQQLIAEIHTGGHVYVRNLAAAEAAILKGQFNLAKVLRASAHAQRMLSMEAARLLASDWDPTELPQRIVTELEHESAPEVNTTAPDIDSAVEAKLAQFAAVRERLKDIALRSLASLRANKDVDQLLERLGRTRSASLELVRGLKPEQWTRQGTLLGTMTSVLDLGSWLANHDQGHLAQIRRLCRQ